MTIFAGVIGWPVAHSRSPQMHNAAYEELGLDWRYFRLPIAPRSFRGVVAALPCSGYRGVNVTLPHKVTALRMADQASAVAAGIGAANTLTFGSGQIYAENTDAPGFIDALASSPAGHRALVLGAGGAARAVAWALREAGASVSVWNRTSERARRLAADLNIEYTGRPRPTDLLVNATSVGLDRSAVEREILDALELRDLQVPATLVDLVWTGRRSVLCEWASRSGARIVDGLEVLVRQGARSFESWTGQKAPLDVMRTSACRG